jgi:hypothetical protein
MDGLIGIAHAGGRTIRFNPAWAQRAATDDVLLRPRPTHEFIVRFIGVSPRCYQKRETDRAFERSF